MNGNAAAFLELDSFSVGVAGRQPPGRAGQWKRRWRFVDPHEATVALPGPFIMVWRPYLVLATLEMVESTEADGPVAGLA